MKIDKSEHAKLKEITHSPWEDVNPLSYQQLGIWFLCELIPDSPVWNVLYCKRLKGKINVDYFNQACQALVNRHAALRTNVVIIDGQPYQKYVEMKGDIVQLIDFSQLDKETRESKAQTLIDTETHKPIAIHNERLFKIFLIKLATEEYILLMNFHHFMSDHVSVYMIACDLKNFYNAHFNIEPFLRPLPIEYNDYVLWQRKVFARQYSDEQEEYLNQFKGKLPVIDLPTKTSPTSERNYISGVEKIVLDKQLIKHLNKFSFKNKVITFSSFLAAYFVLLYKYSQQNDILIATLFSGRDYNKHLLPMVGYFTNTVALRMNFDDDPDFEEFVKRVHERVSDAYTMPNYPFERLVQKIKSNKKFGPTPLFQTAFNVLNFNKEPYSFHDIDEETRIETARLATPTDLMLEIRNYSDRTEIIFIYSTDIFEKNLVSNLARHYVNILYKVSANSQVKLGTLNLLDDQEKDRILTQWNKTHHDFPNDKCLHELIEDRVKQKPGNIAVVFENLQLTYEQLNQKANQLAWHLIKLGVKPDTLVGLCMERSLEMMVGLLGILKAGGAYVPIDPDYPIDRVDYMLENSAADIILTQEKFLGKLSLSQQRVICLDNQQQVSELNIYSIANPDKKDLGLGVRKLAYMIYTSGSTGKPKGVLIEHQAIVNRLDWMQKKYPLTEKDNILQKTPFSFDVSVWEFFWPLMIGSRITMARPEGHKDPKYISEVIQKEKVTVLHFVPSMLNVLLSAINWGECQSVRQVFCSGERLSPETVTRYYESGTKAVLSNLYGPTEAAVDVSYWDCNPNQLRTIPIGKPINNTVLHILDKNNIPVPIGVPGELHIGGICLARGYLNRPELTRDKFIPNPFSKGRDERLYKTGDLVRYLHDGNIEYMGRSDHQVKIRGYRIELGEIETVLDQHPNIQESVVMACEIESGDNVLVAYLVSIHGQTIERAAIRSYLKEKLPEYMIPAVFVMLDEMPLSPNGKVNRRALPSPDRFEIQSIDDLILPRDTIELRISQIWEDILSVYPIGVKDSFFEIGDSLQGVRLLARIGEEFGVNLPLSVLFQEGTIESMANIIRQGKNQYQDSSLVPIQGKGIGVPLFLIHPIGGSVLCYSELARMLDTDFPIYGLQAMGLMDDQEPLKTMEELAIRYIEEIRKVQAHGPYHLGGWSFGGSVAYCMAGKLKQMGEKVDWLLLIDTYAYIGDAKPEKINESTEMTMFIKDLGGFFGREIPIEIGSIIKHDPKSRLNYIMETAQSHNILPPEIGLAKLNSMFKVYQTNLHASYNYTPEYFEGMVTLFSAAHSSEKVEQDPTLGWGTLLGDNLTVQIVPGDHYSIIHKPNVNILADKLKECMNGSVDKNADNMQNSCVKLKTTTV